MKQYGYTLACADVAGEASLRGTVYPFEDWYVSLDLLTESAQQGARRLGGLPPEGW